MKKIFILLLILCLSFIINCEYDSETDKNMNVLCYETCYGKLEMDIWADANVNNYVPSDAEFEQANKICSSMCINK